MSAKEDQQTKVDDKKAARAADIADRQAHREATHSVEMRSVLALEQIADELTALRQHLTNG